MLGPNDWLAPEVLLGTISTVIPLEDDPDDVVHTHREDEAALRWEMDVGTSRLIVEF